MNTLKNISNVVLQMMKLLYLALLAELRILHMMLKSNIVRNILNKYNITFQTFLATYFFPKCFLDMYYYYYYDYDFYYFFIIIIVSILFSYVFWLLHGVF